MSLFKRKEKKVGIAEGRRRYDLPLGRGEGSGFLVLLIVLMTILAVMALAASFSLSGIAKRWTTGLENHYTVEIPATDKDGKVRDSKDIQKHRGNMEAMLKSLPFVMSVTPLSNTDIHELIEPWIGDQNILDTVPVPGLLAIQVRDGSQASQDILKKKIKNVVPNAVLDSHQEWLNDVLRFTNAMKFATSVLVLIITSISITAVASAIRSRISIHKTEVELLHLMGASDSYISRQFQRYASSLAFKGAFIGTLLGGGALFVLSKLSGEMAVNLIPDFYLENSQILTFICIPFIAGLIALLTARQTVLNVLVKMP